MSESHDQFTGVVQPPKKHVENEDSNDLSHRFLCKGGEKMGMSENENICKIVEACLGVVSALLMVEIVAIILVVTIVVLIVALGEDRILE